MVTLMQIARHEAGHCFVAWYYGLHIDKVSTRFNPLQDGIQGSCFARQQDSELKNAAWVDYIIAGGVVDDLSGHGLSSAKLDFEMIKDIFRLSDDVLKMHLFFKQNPKADIKTFYEKFKGPALKLLKSQKGKRCIKALGDELLQYGTLSGQSAVETLEKAWGLPLPKMSLPAEQHGKALTSKISDFDNLVYRIKFYVDAVNADIEAFDACKSADQERQFAALKSAIMQLNFILFTEKELEICSSPKK